MDECEQAKIKVIINITGRVRQGSHNGPPLRVIGSTCRIEIAPNVLTVVKGAFS